MLGVIHILRDHQGGFRNDYANVIFGGGLETDKSDYVICERPLNQVAHWS